MPKKLKRDQISQSKVKNWKKSLKEEENLTLNLKIPKIVLQKDTYINLAGENENRIRIYLGLEEIKENQKPVLCAFAVSTFLLGSGDVYVDYETPVYKLEKDNVDFSSKINDVIDSIKRYRKWRAGELAQEDDGADVRKFIYPNAYLLTKFELHEMFNVQNKKEVVVEFGISKFMNAMLTSDKQELETETLAVSRSLANDESEYYNYTEPCPPNCDDGSVYNS